MNGVFTQSVGRNDTQEAGGAELFDRLCFLEFLNLLFGQTQNLTEHAIIVRADPGRRTCGAGSRNGRYARQTVMRDFTPRLPVGFDDVTARAEMDIVEKIFSGRWNTG